MALSTIAAVVYIFLQTCAATPGTVVTAAETDYDYVVVGGGTSGCVIANRLTEDGKTTVLVIESGPILDGKRETDDVLIPAVFEKANTSPVPYTWPNITSEPIEGLNGHTKGVVIAKVAGGGSAVNGKLFTRGSKRDHDDWARYLDDDGWGWDSILTSFKKSETFTPPIESYHTEGNVTWNMDVHGTNGPISSTFPPQMFPSTKYIIAAEKALGIPQKHDQGDGDPVGGIWFPASVRADEFTRSYSKREYYDSARTRANLHFLADNTAIKITFDGNRATGVEYAPAPNASAKTVRARKEVILAAGSIKSPQLLQVSGVGPKRLSQALGIRSVADLPVGENYQDHGVLLLNYSLSITFNEKMWYDKNNKTWMDAQYAEFLTNRTGYYTVSSDNHMALFSMSMLHKTGSKSLLADLASRNHTQYLRPGVDEKTSQAYSRQLNITFTSMATEELAVDEIMNFGRRTVLVKPLSRGFIEAKTLNIWEPPKFNYRTLSHPLDIENVLASLKMSRRLLGSAEMQPLSPVENTPGVALQTDDELREFIRENFGSGGAHGCCSAPMGTVLDSKMRVLGVKGLRVVDTSSWPMIPGAHALQSTAYAVAERAADLIKLKCGSS